MPAGPAAWYLSTYWVPAERVLANRAVEQTLTITHVPWAMFGILPRGRVQLPYRHRSVAVDHAAQVLGPFGVQAGARAGV